MPLYEYRCRDCGHQFEIQQSITDDALSTCPQCQGALRKVFAPVGISFKGSGFYKTDSRSGTSSKGSDGSSSGSSGSGSTSSSGDSTSGSSSGDGGSSSSGGSTGGGSESSGSSSTAATTSSD